MSLPQSLNIRLELSPEAAEEFKRYHLRATNTLEPDKWPEWLKALDAQLEASKPGVGTRTQNGDLVSIVKGTQP